MKFKGMSRAHLFLIELIIAVLFFSFVGAVTIQVFAKAFRLADDTVALNGAVLAVQTAAETDKTARLADILPTIRTTGYTEDWEAVDPSGAMYTVTTEVTFQQRQVGTMVVYNYTAMADEKIIYRLTAKKYYAEQMGIDASSGEVD
ncbi:MAG TPA: hypothetical protein GX523_20295 [Desulfitobacterium dehalogenans]|uniref:Uncharacterized protein n=1 Tax=Desulfitobacterium dehalogenans TaxID=36854 RepID=A0A7C6Z7Q9_9FIRM|nr:hypothetical protein [Desulfitobacterium dehalogenans]